MIALHQLSLQRPSDRRTRALLPLSSNMFLPSDGEKRDIYWRVRVMDVWTPQMKVRMDERSGMPARNTLSSSLLSHVIQTVLAAAGAVISPRCIFLISAAMLSRVKSSFPDGASGRVTKPSDSLGRSTVQTPTNFGGITPSIYFLLRTSSLPDENCRSSEERSSILT